MRERKGMSDYHGEKEEKEYAPHPVHLARAGSIYFFNPAQYCSNQPYILLLLYSSQVSIPPLPLYPCLQYFCLPCLCRALIMRKPKPYALIFIPRFAKLLHLCLGGP